MKSNFSPSRRESSVLVKFENFCSLYAARCNSYLFGWLSTSSSCLTLGGLSALYHYYYARGKSRSQRGKIRAFYTLCISISNISSALAAMGFEKYNKWLARVLHTYQAIACVFNEMKLCLAGHKSNIDFV